MDHDIVKDDETLLNECKQAGWSPDTYLFPLDPIIGENMGEALGLREVEKAALDRHVRDDRLEFDVGEMKQMTQPDSAEMIQEADLEFEFEEFEFDEHQPLELTFE